MAIARSIVTRLVEGLLRNFRLDADLVAAFGSKMYKGPLLGEDPSPLDPLQLHVNAAPAEYRPGVANASTVSRVVIVTILDHYDVRPVAEGSPTVWGVDYIEHIEKLVMAGGNGVTTNDLGRITDTDSSGMLNNSVLRMTPQPYFASIKDVAIVHRLVVEFETRINQQMTRV